MDIRDSPHYRHDAPGARLDSEPWARSWPAYLAAVFGDLVFHQLLVFRKLPVAGDFDFKADKAAMTDDHDIRQAARRVFRQSAEVSFFEHRYSVLPPEEVR